MKFVFMRHGNYVKFQDRQELSVTGIKKIQGAKMYLIRIFNREVVIYSSPSYRCLETSEILRDISKIIVRADQLDERSDFTNISDFMDKLLGNQEDSIIVTHKPIIDLIMHYFNFPEIYIEESGFIYILYDTEPHLVAIFQPSIFLL